MREYLYMFRGSKRPLSTTVRSPWVCGVQSAAWRNPHPIEPHPKSTAFKSTRSGSGAASSLSEPYPSSDNEYSGTSTAPRSRPWNARLNTRHCVGDGGERGVEVETF